MAHHFLITIVLYLSQGAAVVLFRHALSQPLLEMINWSRATVLYAAPYHYALLARDISQISIPTVRLAVSTTCALSQDIAVDFSSRFGFPLVQGFGVIELGLVCLNQGDPHGRWNSVGRPLADFRLRIVAPDQDACGEVAVSGPGMLDAYAAPWLARDEILRDGWFLTGDIGRVDQDGFLFLISRKTAVINLAGRKVFPEEIEAVLNQHPAVLESRVFGRNHTQLGEVVEAEVVLKPSGADLNLLQAFCRKHLAPFKIPSRFHVVCALQRTPTTGKILRTSQLILNDGNTENRV
jgi:acyl-coenzyme A synthetase/AMP-(fatty) acid ligase